MVFCALLTVALCVEPGISRARLYNVNTRRFQTMDAYAGNNEDPLSLHKYLYAADNPVDNVDPSGNDFELGGLLAVIDFSGMLAQIGAPVTLSTIGLPRSSSVEVYSHPAEGSRYQHTYLKLTVASPTDFPNQKMQRGPDGENFFIISGEEKTGWSRQYLVGNGLPQLRFGQFERHE